MTIPQAIKEGTSRLQNTDFCESPLLDTLLLLSSATSLSKETLLAAGEKELISKSSLNSYLNLIRQRESGESVAAILGEKEFFGRTFSISSEVLSPRPDTEFAVEAALNLIQENSYKYVLDLCTGPGTIALTILAEAKNKELTILGSDISLHAKEFFEINNNSLCQGRANFLLSDLFNNIKNSFDIIITNPPYLTSLEYKVKNDLGWKEPQLALDGGKDGLDYYKEIVSEAPFHLNPQGTLVMEAAASQMKVLSELLKENGFEKIQIISDLSGEERIITGQLI